MVNIAPGLKRLRRKPVNKRGIEMRAIYAFAAGIAATIAVLAVMGAKEIGAEEGAQEQAQEVKEQALSDLRGQVASLAIAAAQKVIGEALDEKRQHALIEQFFSGVKDGKIVLLEDESVSGASAEVTSALPLTDKEQETIREDIVGKLGDSATITFRVDPNILGGLVIRVGDKVLDGSVSGKLSGLKQSLR